MATPHHLRDSHRAQVAKRRGIEGRRWDFCWGRKVDFRKKAWPKVRLRHQWTEKGTLRGGQEVAAGLQKT